MWHVASAGIRPDLENCALVSSLNRMNYNYLDRTRILEAFSKALSRPWCDRRNRQKATAENCYNSVQVCGLVHNRDPIGISMHTFSSRGDSHNPITWVLCAVTWLQRLWLELSAGLVILCIDKRQVVKAFFAERQPQFHSTAKFQQPCGLTRLVNGWIRFLE